MRWVPWRVTKGDPPFAALAGGKRSATPVKVTAKNTASRKRDKHPRLLLSVDPVKGRICLLFRALDEAAVGLATQKRQTAASRGRVGWAAV
jgi:hypothetical protein